MKKLILLVALFMALTGLIFTGVSAPLFGRAAPTAPPVLFDDVLRAHNVAQSDTLLAFVADATKLHHLAVEPGSELPGLVELKVSVAASGSAFRRHRFDPHGSWEIREFFDGQDAHRSEIYNGTPAGPAMRLPDMQFRAARFGVMTFGLVPIIKRLQEDPTVEITYLGRVSGKQDKFSVKIDSENWTLYTDDRHLITRVDMGNKTFSFADFRTVGKGVVLPFIQRLSVSGRLVSELFFTRIDLSPSFPVGFFKPESIPAGAGS